MYCGEEGSNTNSVLEKETLQLSPHIAAHKSSTNFVNIPFLGENAHGDNHLSPRLISIPSNTAVYKLNVDLPYNIRSPHSVLQSSGILPEDLSAAPGKTAVITTDVAVKPLPVVQPVISQTIDGFSGSLIVSDRTPTFYSFADGATVAITGQHPAVFVSSVNGDNSTGGAEVYRTRSESDGSCVSNAIMTSTVQSTGSHQDMTILPFQPGMHEGQLIVPEIMSAPIIWDDQDVKKLIKNEDEVEQKDLVRQALQAAVAHSSPRMSSDDILVHDYGSSDCISEDGICHSTFSVQSKPQEVLMMSGPLGSIENNAKYIGAVSTLLPTDIPNGAQVLVLQAASVPEVTNGSTVDHLPIRRKRPKEVATPPPPRKKNVANRMKEKRANESDEQRMRRRSREAERMRKKRLQEDESTKERRRHEAADRARKRRANLSPSERELERKKAAHRMRVRRLKENEGERKVRRDKAAQRMRLRRSKETPEEKAVRRQTFSSIKVKSKRKKDSRDSNSLPVTTDDFVKHEEDDPLAVATPPRYRDPSNSPSPFHKNTKDGRSNGTPDHILLNSALSNPSANFTLMSNDVGHVDARFVHLPLPPEFPEPIPVEVRNLSSVESQRIPSMSVNPSQHLTTINERIVTQAPPSYSESVSPVVVAEPHNEMLQKSSATQLGIHHLPHLLHHQHLSSYPSDHQYHPDQSTAHHKNH